MSLALYRKYRSQDLPEVVGQQHITQTLEASLTKGQISHAYLFSGPRGTGKTSVARILARRINKLKADDDTNSYLDIIEIDAASNRGIDEMRSLREKLHVAPSQLAYKVYIIDEAHMLTKEAFNALLKSLEEPPSHVVFILATTEAHKLPETILSRMQRYEFRMFSEEVIASHLLSVAKKEGLTVNDESMTMLAELSRGGMRDALSMLDQLASLGLPITQELVQQQFGLSSSEELRSIINAATKGDQEQLTSLLQTVFSSGTEPRILTMQLQAILRQALLGQNVLGDTPQAFIIRALELLTQALDQFRYSAHPSLPIEIALIKLCLHNNSPQPPNVDQSVVVKPQPKQGSLKKPEKPTKSKEGNKTDQDVPRLTTKALSVIKEHNNSLYALLYSGGAKINGDLLVVSARFDFHKQRIEEYRNRALIEKIFSKVFGRPIELHCELLSNIQESREPEPEQSEELVNSAMAILGGELIDE